MGFRMAFVGRRAPAPWPSELQVEPVEDIAMLVRRVLS
jgi:hypothetical protein